MDEKHNGTKMVTVVFLRNISQQSSRDFKRNGRVYNVRGNVQSQQGHRATNIPTNFKTSATTLHGAKFH